MSRYRCPADVAAMTFFMADGFLLDQIIDPELDAGLYGRMFEVFMRGLMGMSDWEGERGRQGD